MIQHRVIGLMYTRTCPLACRHCITESSPRARGRMQPEQVRRYLPALRRFTSRISFTGGEPLLFHREICALSAEARGMGLEVSVVTGAGWVKNSAMAEERIRELAAAGIGYLAISWDAYHEEFAPRENALSLAEAGCRVGMAVELRSVSAPGGSAEYHRPFAHLPVRLDSGPPVKLGAAANLPDADFQWHDTPRSGVCDVVLRPVIEPDGMVYACCGPGHFSRRPSPLVLGNAEEEPLEQILARGANDPVLEAISLIGPHGLYRLLETAEAGKSGLDVRSRYTGICELCLDINGNPAAVGELRKRLEDTDAQILLAAARMWAERRGRVEARPVAAQPVEA